MRIVYLDYNATTPLDPAVRDAMLPYLGEVWGNPSSIHHVGRRARAALDDARDRTAAVLRCKPAEVVFTSGGTESINLAVLGTARCLKSKGRHIITSAIEHHAVLHSADYLTAHEGFEVTHLPVDQEGRVSPDDLRAAVRPDTVLVSIMAANNEIGTIQPVAELGRICRERGIVFHTDAVQWFGKEPLASVEDFHADLLSVCAHKFHGPKGVGLLYRRSPLKPHSTAFGGPHENGQRAGTENLAAIVGFVTALERFVPSPVFDAVQLRPLVDRLLDGMVVMPQLQFLGSRHSRLVNTAAFLVPRFDSTTLLAALDLEGICASGGSACTAGSLQPSHVVEALRVHSDAPAALLRFSLGRDSTPIEVEHVLACLPRILAREQAR